MASKPRATGADAVVLFGKEVTYATPPDGSAGGVYVRPPLKTSELSGSQPLEDDQLWNTGSSEDTDPSLGAFDASGDITAPLDSRGAGFWLTAALGAEPAAPVHDADAGTYLHTWQSGEDISSYTVQTGHPKLTTPKWKTAKGAKAGGFSFQLARNGRAILTLPMIAQSEAKDTPANPRDAAPLVYDYLPFDNATGSVKVNGTQLASLTGGTITYSSTPEAIETIRPDMFIDGIDEGIRTLSGSFDLRLGTDHTIDDLVDGGTSCAVEVSFTLRSQPTWKFVLTMPRVFFERSKQPIDGPGGIQITTNWRAAKDATAGYMLQVTLLNDVAAY